MKNKIIDEEQNNFSFTFSSIDLGKPVKTRLIIYYFSYIIRCISNQCRFCPSYIVILSYIQNQLYLTVILNIIIIMNHFVLLKQFLLRKNRFFLLHTLSLCFSLWFSDKNCEIKVRYWKISHAFQIFNRMFFAIYASAISVD